jgi:hypothetical protein
MITQTRASLEMEAALMGLTQEFWARMSLEDHERWTVPRKRYEGTSQGVLEAESGDFTVAKEPTDWLPSAVRALRELLRLPDNWDGFGGPAPDAAIVDSAERVLALLHDMVPPRLSTPFVCPISGGGLQVEWTSDTKHLEIEFVTQSEVEFLTEDLKRIGEADAMQAGETDIRTGMGALCEKLTWFAA